MSVESCLKRYKLQIKYELKTEYKLQTEKINCRGAGSINFQANKNFKYNIICRRNVNGRQRSCAAAIRQNI